MTDANRVSIPIEEFPDPVVAYALEGDEPRITAANGAFESGFDDIQAGASVATVFDRFGVVEATGDAEPVTHLRRGDAVGVYLDGVGERGPFFARVLPSGDGTGYVLLSDLNERPEIPAAPAVDQVSSVISHDLRNPLDVAEAHLRAARETGDEEHFDAVADAHERMERIIRDVLTVTRDRTQVDPSEEVSIETAARDAWRSVDTERAALEVAGPLPTVAADPDLVRRLFENLFRNAVEHGSTSPPSQAQEDAVEHGSTSPPSDGQEDAVEHGSTSPDSQARRDAVEHGSTGPRSQAPEDAAGTSSGEPSVADAPEDAVEHGSDADDCSADRERSADAGRGVTVTAGPLEDGFYVADDGPGIPPDERSDVFDPGYSTRDGGTGLGLAIVERVVAGHDWELTLTTADGGGARFEIRF